MLGFSFLPSQQKGKGKKNFATFAPRAQRAVNKKSIKEKRYGFETY
jgi:hypothetical protein